MENPRNSGKASVPPQGRTTARASVPTPAGAAASGVAQVPGETRTGTASVPVRSRIAVEPGGIPGRPITEPRRGKYAASLISSDEQKKRRRRKRIKKFALWGVAALLLFFVIGMGAVYAAVQVPLPNPTALNQVSYFYYSDGSEMARLGVENREQVKLKSVPKHVQRAVVAAEDRSFWSNEGVSLRGTLRALWANMQGEELQGGSTITQQYVKNAFLTQERTFSRKMKELVLAVKMDNEYSKDQIMEFYLNTIYLGRGAYGIQAASKTYFGVPVDQMTPEQAALIAGMIRAPSFYEPETNLEGAKERWEYVLTGMKDKGWYKGSVDSAKFPEILPSSQASEDKGLSGPTGTIMTRVEQELIDAGISEQVIRTGGLRVTTTINPKMQQAMEVAVAENMEGQPENLQAAAVGVEPGTGKVLAYYGGDKGFRQFDFAGPGSPHAPGSSFKPYVLAAGIEQGISVNSVWDGSSPRTFPDRADKPVSNSENNNNCPRCTLTQATVLSLNTTYYALTAEVGAKSVAEMAQRSGITTLDGDPIDEMKNEVNNNIGLGTYGISVLDQAAGYATFAGKGVYAAPHFVEKVTQGEQVLYEPDHVTAQAFSADVSADLTYVLDQVANVSSGRPVAGKTGTHQYLDTGENSNAWMSGYATQLAAAVWVGNKENEGPIRDKSNSMIWGSGLPSTIWKSFMEGALDGAPKEAFPKAPLKGDTDAGDAKTSPTPTGPRSTVNPDDDFPRPTDFPTHTTPPYTTDPVQDRVRPRQ